MTKVAATPTYGKNLKKSSSPEPKGRWHWKLVCSIGCSSTTRFIQMMTLSWPWPILQPRSNLVPYAFVWNKGKTMDFSETVVVYDLKLATDDRNDKKFLLTSKLCPLGAVFPVAPGIYIYIKSWKKLYKIRLQRDFFESYNKWVSDEAFLLGSKFCPLAAVYPCPGLYIYVLNHERNCIKSDFKDIFWNLQQMNEVTRHFCWNQNFVPWGLFTPAPGLYTCIK